MKITVKFDVKVGPNGKRMVSDSDHKLAFRGAIESPIVPRQDESIFLSINEDDDEDEIVVDNVEYKFVGGTLMPFVNCIVGGGEILLSSVKSAEDVSGWVEGELVPRLRRQGFERVAEVD